MITSGMALLCAACCGPDEAENSGRLHHQGDRTFYSIQEFFSQDGNFFDLLEASADSRQLNT
jgi:hypothetical protein